MDRKFKATVRYTIHDNQGSGRFTETSTSVFIDETTSRQAPSRNCLNFALECSHPNYLPCILIDAKNNVIAHIMHDKTLFQHTMDLKDNDIYPVMQYYYPCKNVISQYIHNFVPEDYTFLIKGMIKFVFDMHEKDIALSPFSIENLVIKDNRLCFRMIWFKKRATEKRKKKDYKCICSVIDYLFDTFRLEIPPILKDLYEKMRDYDESFNLEESDYVYENYFVDHIALMSHSQRVAFIKKCDEVGKELIDEEGEGYWNIINGPQMKPDWDAIIRNNEDEYGPLYDSLQLGNYDDSNEKMVRFWRNITTHLIEYSYSYDQEFGDFDADMVIIARFEEELTYFQGMLYHESIYTKFL